MTRTISGAALVLSLTLSVSAIAAQPAAQSSNLAVNPSALLAHGMTASAPLMVDLPDLSGSSTDADATPLEWSSKDATGVADDTALASPDKATPADISDLGR